MRLAQAEAIAKNRKEYEGNQFDHAKNEQERDRTMEQFLFHGCGPRRTASHEFVPGGNGADGSRATWTIAPKGGASGRERINRRTRSRNSVRVLYTLVTRNCVPRGNGADGSPAIWTLALKGRASGDERINRNT